MKRFTLIASLGGFLLGAAASASATDAAALWATNCAACHGKDGTGHTRAGRMAHVKDMTSADYQKTFTDAQAAAQIRNGFKDSTGRMRMKAFGDTLAPAEVQDLVAYVRSLKK
jgi:mono/diheme cytochrome c family protein